MLASLTVTESETEASGQLDGFIQGNRGAYIDRLGEWSEAYHLNADQVDSVGQTLGDQLARIVGHERFPILVGFADQLDRSVL